jgi:anti-sigma B factor antagonist
VAISARNESTVVETNSVRARLEMSEVSRESQHRLVLSGELDLASAAELKATLERLCRTGTSLLVMDLRKVTFMDSTGLQMVLTAKHLCERCGSDFSIIPGPHQVQRVFEVTRLLERLPFGEQPA